MTNPTPHGQAPEALIDLIDAYAETRHRCGGIYNAKTEAARKAVIEALSGVQALSAAPAVPNGDELRRIARSARTSASDDASPTEYVLAGWKAAMLAASPTPPAEQAAPKAVPAAVGHDEDLLEKLYWEFDSQRKKTGEDRLAFKVKMRFYASEFLRRSDGKMTFAQSVSDDMMNLADRLGSEFDDVDPRAWKHLLVYAPKAAPGEPVHGDVLPPVGSRVYIRHGRDNDAHACAVTGYYAWGDLGGDKRLHRVFVRLVYEGTDRQQARMLCDCYPTAEAALAQTASQQEAQEPVAISEAIERMAADRYKVVPSHESMFHRWAVVAGTGTQQLYLGREVECQNMARKFAGAFLDGAFVTMQSTAPQPAPAPLSDDAKDAARYRWLREGNDAKHGAAWHVAVNLYGCEWDAAIDAAIAAQGGTP